MHKCVETCISAPCAASTAEVARPTKKVSSVSATGRAPEKGASCYILTENNIHDTQVEVSLQVLTCAAGLASEEDGITLRSTSFTEARVHIYINSTVIDPRVQSLHKIDSFLLCDPQQRRQNKKQNSVQSYVREKAC